MNWNTKFADRTRLMKRSTVREFLKLSEGRDIISFAAGLPGPELFPVKEVEEALERACRNKTYNPLQYGPTEGMKELRAWIAERVFPARCGLSPENVLITSGAQQALDLLGKVLINEGDAVALSEPAYLALLSAWRGWGAVFNAINSDEKGILTNDLALVNAKTAYVIPNFHNPTGATMPLERRFELCKWAARTGTILLEDDPYGALRYEGHAIKSILECSREMGCEDCVVHVGSFSKTLSPGLRVGFIAGPPELIDCCVRAKQAMDLNTSMLNQAIAFELLSNTTFFLNHLNRLRSTYKEKRDAMLSTLNQLFHDCVWTNPEGGMFIYLRLPDSASAEELSKAAINQGVAVVPARDFYVSKPENALRLNFTHPSLAQIERGMAMLGRVFAERNLAIPN